ncbi:MAG: hypothetical protein ACXVI8_06665 [Halobacteriota archaeon]
MQQRKEWCSFIVSPLVPEAYPPPAEKINDPAPLLEAAEQDSYQKRRGVFPYSTFLDATMLMRF